MKVLWFAVTPSLYDDKIRSHNGGGWIASLEQIIKVDPNIELAIAFEHEDTIFKVMKNGVHYYPIKNKPKSIIKRLKSKYSVKEEEETIIPQCIKIIQDYNPDVIHIFGSEWVFGLITEYTNIPCIIHIQGSIPPYNNAHYPPNYNILSEYTYNKLNIKKSINAYLGSIKRKKRAKREEHILKNCKYFMGRTNWDNALRRLYAPDSKYYYCSEALRPQILEATKWELQDRNIIKLISVSSASPLKGFDVIIKTAKLLKEHANIQFEWNLLGPSKEKLVYFEKKENVKLKDLNIIAHGVADISLLVKSLQNSDIFVHLAYIDNSPNAICEAQLLGLPIIATYVGGIPSLIEDNDTGLLLPTNDPYYVASEIVSLAKNKNKMKDLSKKAQEVAMKRHDMATIKNDLLKIYQTIQAENTQIKL